MFVPIYVSMHESSEYITITLFAAKSVGYLYRAIWLFGVRLFAFSTIQVKCIVTEQNFYLVLTKN
jgi:hypothetical protein